MRRKQCLVPAAILLAAVAAGPVMAAPYTLQAVIAIPATGANVQPGGEFTSFDISFFDPATGIDYIADRSNASVDMISGTTLKVVGQAQGFTGQQATTSVSGADGVLTVSAGGTTTLYAGDGNSTLKVFNVTNPAAPVLLQSIATPSGVPLTRVDEMAYSPTTHQILAANNAASPAFATLFSTSGPPGAPASITKTLISIPGAAAGDGMEQPVWNPSTGTFFVSIPAFNGDAGGVAEIKTDGTVGRLFKFATLLPAGSSCAATGLALGASGNLMVGCSPGAGFFAQAVLLNPAGNGGAGSIVKTFAISGTDEIWYDPTTNSYFVTGKNAGGQRGIDVISDATDLETQFIPLPVLTASNPHSIAVDSLNGDIFVPLAGSTSAVPNTFCPLGCVEVFGVPEPGSLPILLLSATMLVGLGARRRWHRA